MALPLYSPSASLSAQEENNIATSGGEACQKALNSVPLSTAQCKADILFGGGRLGILKRQPRSQDGFP